MTTTTSLARDAAAITRLAEEVASGRTDLTAAQARELLEVVPGSPEQQALFAGARAIRDAFVGRDLRCCSVVNVKAGNCSEDCGYCAQAGTSAASDYKKTKWIPDEQIALATDSAHENGAQALGLVAAWWGGKEGSQLDMVCDAIERFSKNGKVRPDVNLGILENQRCADRIREAGARVYGHNLETARSFFGSICSTHSFEERLETIRYVKKAGMGLCSGGIVGMGESREQRVEFMEQLRLIEPDMIPINFLNPIKGTKLGHLPPLSADEALTTLAVFRWMLPDRNLMVAGGKEVVLGDRLHEVFATGINAVMVGNYLTTSGADPAYWRNAAAKHGMRMREGVEQIENEGGGCAH
jgi:biotin synthase